MRKTGILLISLLMFALMTASFADADSFKPYPETIKGKKIAVYLDDVYQVGEAFYTPRRLEEAGADVTVVGSRKPYVDRYRPTFTHRFKVDMTYKEAADVKWDGVVIIGGFAPLTMRENDDVIKVVREVNSRGGMIAAICHGVCVLVTADVIKGKNVTGNPPRSIEFTNAGAIFHEIAPQVDDNIITAIGPGDNGPFIDAMINWFNGGEEAAKAHLNDQYLKGKKVAILIDNRYKYFQVKYPFVRLTHNGASVYIVADKQGEYREYKNVLGSTKADMAAQDATSERFDAVILVGHYAADTYRRHTDVRQFVTKQLQRGTLIASIDWGHTVFIQANIIKGREFACTKGMRNDIKNAGGTPILEPVHRDRNLITCATDDALPEMMRYVVGYLKTME